MGIVDFSPFEEPCENSKSKLYASLEGYMIDSFSWDQKSR